MPSVADRVKETTTTTGTGTITLAGAVTQFQAFQTAFAVGTLIEYAIVGQGTSEWEVGIGTLLTTTTLSREVVRASSNSNALVNFASGTKDVFSTITGSDASRNNTNRSLMINIGGSILQHF
jgi:hypothetical protein